MTVTGSMTMASPLPDKNRPGFISFAVQCPYCEQEQGFVMTYDSATKMATEECGHCHEDYNLSVKLNDSGLPRIVGSVP